MKAKVNKVKFGLKNVMMAAIENIDNTKTDGTGYEYGEIFAVPGAQSLNLANQFASQSIAADDDPDYVTMSQNNGYDGTLQIVNIPKEFEENILCMKNGIENADTKMKDFAIICEFDGDENRARICLWHCVITKKPDIVHNTKDGNLSVDNDTLSIKVVKRKDTADLRGKAYADWSVYDKMLTAIPKPSDFIDPDSTESGTGDQETA
ncbi:MAG: hypothetical protein J5994_10870 [Ruminococcus sp.]|nr:hypothetical protein [Ruminococcus sp.]